MKLNKLAYMLCFGLTLGAASCSTDKAWEEEANSAAGTIVEFESAELSVKENKGIVHIPVVCSDDINGRVNVTVTVESIAQGDAEKAVEEKHFIVTSKSVNIGSTDKAAFVEFSTVDDGEINNARMFKVTIATANGAKIGAKSSCVVTIKDNDSAFYEKLQGKWKMKYFDIYDGVNGSWDVNIVGYEEGEAGYDQVLYIIGVNGVNYAQAQLNYHFDKTTKKGYVEIPFGSFCAEGLNFGAIGVCDIYLGTVDGNYIVMDGALKGEWSEDFKTITFEEGVQVRGFLVSGGKPNGYAWFGFQDPVLTR
jgi:hypothetical protein